jgi:hypothetical protein
MNWFAKGATGRADGCGQVHRQPAPDQRTQVRPAPLRPCHLIRSAHHLPLRGGSCQVRTAKYIYTYLEYTTVSVASTELGPPTSSPCAYRIGGPIPSGPITYSVGEPMPSCAITNAAPNKKNGQNVGFLNMQGGGSVSPPREPRGGGHTRLR